ncbi:MAG TPA: hypothetical protein VM686_30655, partial [Polyangiaceae bacterium]|nr:hypothetical protein [Polyangiaceae bacterium]
VTFCLRSRSPAVLRAALAPGKTYYVEVEANWGFWSTSGDLLAIKPSGDRWRERERWLAESRGLTLADSSAVDGDDVAEALADCKEELASYDDDELAERTLQRKDGR